MKLVLLATTVSTQYEINHDYDKNTRPSKYQSLDFANILLTVIDFNSSHNSSHLCKLATHCLQ